MDRNEAMSWANQAIWWQVYPLGFAEPPSGTLTQARRLAYGGYSAGWITRSGDGGCLGCSWVQFLRHRHTGMTPSIISASIRGWAETRISTLLLPPVRGSGLRILLDGVFSHVGVEHPALSRVLAGGPESQ